MKIDWRPLFVGPVEDRQVRLLTDGEGAFRVETTQKSESAGGLTVVGSSSMFGAVASPGDPLEIDAEDPDDLQRQLVEFGEFSEHAAAELARLARAPGR